MFQIIGEAVAVIGVYKNAYFKPVKFEWQGRAFSIEKITLISDIRDGGVKKRMYSVLVKGTLYRLMFNRDSEVWQLEELWVE